MSASAEMACTGRRVPPSASTVGRSCRSRRPVGAAARERDRLPRARRGTPRPRWRVPPSVATAGPKYWVAPTSTSTADTSCPTAAYSTVQSAVTAAELSRHAPTAVPTIEICPGTYSEQVTITEEPGAHPGAQGAQRARPGRRSSFPRPSAATSRPACRPRTARPMTRASPGPQSVIEVCAAATGGTNTTGVSRLDQPRHVRATGRREQSATTACTDTGRRRCQPVARRLRRGAGRCLPAAGLPGRRQRRGGQLANGPDRPRHADRRHDRDLPEERNHGRRAWLYG